MMVEDVQVYRLEANGKLLARVVIEEPTWLPVRPQISLHSTWVRCFILRALQLLHA